MPLFQDHIAKRTIRLIPTPHLFQNPLAGKLGKFRENFAMLHVNTASIPSILLIRCGVKSRINQHAYSLFIGLSDFL